MSGKPIRLRPKAKLFKSRDKRGAFFRQLVKRTDRAARRNRQLFELDQRRIEAGPFGADRWRDCPSTHCERWQECRSPHECSATGRMPAHRPLPSQPDAHQAGR